MLALCFYAERRMRAELSAMPPIAPSPVLGFAQDSRGGQTLLMGQPQPEVRAEGRGREWGAPRQPIVHHHSVLVVMVAGA